MRLPVHPRDKIRVQARVQPREYSTRGSFRVCMILPALIDNISTRYVENVQLQGCFGDEPSHQPTWFDRSPEVWVGTVQGSGQHNSGENVDGIIPESQVEGDWSQTGASSFCETLARHSKRMILINHIPAT